MVHKLEYKAKTIKFLGENIEGPSGFELGSKIF